MISASYPSINTINPFRIIRYIATRSLTKSSTMDLSAMRKSYRTEEEALQESKLPSNDPFELFKIWFQSANDSGKLFETNAVCVSTCSSDGKPSSRMVLLKGFSKEQGFCFFTNRNSRKSQELLSNSNGSMLFYWDPLNQQVRIEGNFVELARARADEYFQKRPKSSQISAAISNQSSPIPSRENLIELQKDAERKYENLDKIPTPESWTGFGLIPDYFEFWQGQTNRLHDRITFTRQCGADRWDIKRLQP